MTPRDQAIAGIEMIAANSTTDAHRPRLSWYAVKSPAAVPRANVQPPPIEYSRRACRCCGSTEALGAIPEDEDDGDNETERRSGHAVAKPGPIVDGISGHRPEHGGHGHREPVIRSAVLRLAQLKSQREHQPKESHHGGERDTLLTQEVGHRLSHPGGQQLQHPEDQRDLGHLHEDRLQARAARLSLWHGFAHQFLEVGVYAGHVRRRGKGPADPTPAKQTVRPARTVCVQVISVYAIT